MIRILFIIAAMIYVLLSTIIGRYLIEPKKHDMIDYILVSLSGFLVLSAIVGLIGTILWVIYGF